GLEIDERNTGFIITDEENNRIIQLDRLTGLVWKCCDGEKSPWEIQTEIRSVYDLYASEEDIWLSLTELKRMDLLSADSDDSIERYSALLKWEEETLSPAAA
ncbi:MAG: PqqD family peptide modification chaperone, partial [Acidobacteria bacterium]|nr:PqqD family peptide modification chaperone [Acidobacteriota bacterium]